MAITNRLRYAVVSVFGIYIFAVILTAPNVFADVNNTRLGFRCVLGILLIAIIWNLFRPINDNSIFNLHRESSTWV